MPLNDKSTAHLDQYTALELLLKNNPLAVAVNSAFAARRILFAETLVKCYKYRDAANNSTKGYTKTKNKNKRDTSTSGSAITGKGNSYGITTGDTTLSAQMETWTESFLYKTNDPDFAGVIQSIVDTLSPFIATDPLGTAPYFTTPLLNALQLSKGKYVDSLDLFKNAVGVINTAKGNFVAIAIPDAETHITFMEGFLKDIAVLYPDFVTQFQAIVAKMALIGKRHLGASAEMYYDIDGKVINTVGELRITNYPLIKHPKIIHTNTNGIIELLQLKIGTWDAIFSAPGCIDQPVTIKVETKKVTHFIIRMVATPPVVPPAV